ncbi:ABC transporter permease [Speluncibacter jeojiensis]|uniref:ABC transporter permease n=1 Tax=Speluncibacter jeojiensis TaxID=2710754 RepID=A0A9X4LYX6_9ACTN|nr:ABC transporter permease [Corynebacteriales bacterium D3-21]
MTTPLTVTTPAFAAVDLGAPPRPAGRILAAARMHLVSVMFVAMPVLVGLSAFLINLIIFALVDTGQALNGTGGLAAFLGTYFAAYMAATQAFSFALGVSLTRREFFTGTVALALVQSVLAGLAIYLLSLIESATNGWGVQMRFFGLVRYLSDNPGVQLGAPIAFCMLLALAAMLIGAVYTRWKGLGMLGLSVGAVLAFGVVAIVITWQGWWPGFADLFTGPPVAVPLIVYPLAAAAVAGTGAYGVLRRAIP